MGLGLFSAYVLTLAALAMVTAAQVPAVAAIRESSILFVIVLSWLAATPRGGRGGGRSGPTLATVLGGAFVFGGVVLLAIT